MKNNYFNIKCQLLSRVSFSILQCFETLSLLVSELIIINLKSILVRLPIIYPEFVKISE